MNGAREQADEFRRTFSDLKAEIRKVIIGHERIVEEVLICLLVGGHVLVEGVPGLGKTILAKTLSNCLDLEFSRIQFTPDLMPADITGTNVVTETQTGREIRFQKGPLFGQIVLADEINRATPKTQSALLEAMQERAVTVGGVSYSLTDPFLVLATENPIEFEGTYALPEAQLDRFLFKLTVTAPGREELVEIVERTTSSYTPVVHKVTGAAGVERLKAFVREVPLAAQVKDYIARLILATRPDDPSAPAMVKRFVRYGASPRGAQALALGAKATALLSGRFNVSFEDIPAVALPALRHRVILSLTGEAEGIGSDTIIAEVLASVPSEERRRLLPLSGR